LPDATVDTLYCVSPLPFLHVTLNWGNFSLRGPLAGPGCLTPCYLAGLPSPRASGCHAYFVAVPGDQLPVPGCPALPRADVLPSDVSATEVVGPRGQESFVVSPSGL
jgi:hypothetical protein